MSALTDTRAIPQGWIRQGLVIELARVYQRLGNYERWYWHVGQTIYVCDDLKDEHLCDLEMKTIDCQMEIDYLEWQLGIEEEHYWDDVEGDEYG